MKNVAVGSRKSARVGEGRGVHETFVANPSCQPGLLSAGEETVMVGSPQYIFEASAHVGARNALIRAQIWWNPTVVTLRTTLYKPVDVAGPTGRVVGRIHLGAAHAREGCSDKKTTVHCSVVCN